MPYLEVQLTAKLHRVYDLGERTIIGRSPGCAIQLLSRAVSRRHAGIEVSDAGVVLSDLGAPNGVKVNGQKIQATYNLTEGDRIVVGDVPMTYRAASRTLTAGQSLDLRGQSFSDEELIAHLNQPRSAFTLPADPAFLSTFQSSICRQRIERLELAEESKLKLQIALAEAIENAVTHGANAEEPVQLIFEENDDEFRMSVRDKGPGFDYEKVLAGVEEIDSIAVIKDRASFGTGLGLRMILDCVDRIQFDAEGEGCSIHMAKDKNEDAGMIVLGEDEPPPPSDDPDANPDMEIRID